MAFASLPAILSGLRRNKAGPALIGLQIALTVAVLCNALFIIEQRVALMMRPSGVDEADVFAVWNNWLDKPTDVVALMRDDLATLRGLPGVVDAYATNAYPLEEGGAEGDFILEPERTHSAVPATVYFGDEHTLRTLDIRLDRGRNLSDISNFHGKLDSPPTSGFLITRAMAARLGGGGPVLGKLLTLKQIQRTAPVVGVIDRLQAPTWVSTGDVTGFGSASVIVPYRPATDRYIYMVRAQPGRLAAVMQAAQNSLYAVDRARIIESVSSLADARRSVFRGYRGLVVMLSTICFILLAVTGLGVMGLSSYWVTQRRRHIGVFRALGATRRAVLFHFLTENLLIGAGGVFVGVVLALVANIWLVRSLSMARLPLTYLIGSGAAVIMLGQLAAFGPALRAATVPPAVATRNV